MSAGGSDAVGALAVDPDWHAVAVWDEVFCHFSASLVAGVGGAGVFAGCFVCN